jgi:hypothetical protein
MKSFTLCCPILPGKTEAWKSFNQELGHARKMEFDAMMKRCGVSRSRTWWQKMPQGEMAFVLHEGSSPDRMMNELAKANDPFCMWFKGKVKECHGIDMNAPNASMPVMVELKMDCMH